MTKLKSLQNWNIGTFSNRAVLKQVEIPYVLPKFEIVVDDSLAFTVRVSVMAIIFPRIILSTLIIDVQSGISVHKWSCQTVGGELQFVLWT